MIMRRLVLILPCFLAICKAITNPYSDSIVTLSAMNFFVDENFKSPNNAYLTADFKIEYGYPYGNKIKHSTAFIEMFDQGPQRYGIEDMQIMVENPITYIRATAILGLKIFYDPNNTVIIQQEIFTILENSWQNVNTSFNITFSRPNWFLAGTYSKLCRNDDTFGFQCNVLCPKPSTANECYRCDPTTGNKTCCQDPDYDPFTCFRYGTNGSIPETCEQQLSRIKGDYDYQKKWRTVFFWLFIGFVIIALILLAIIFCCLFSTVYYRRKAEEKQKVYPVDEEWPEVRSVRTARTAKSNPSNQSNQSAQNGELPYTEIYRQPYKRRRLSNPPSPELPRRRAASINTIESELRDSALNYPVYADSPRPRRRIEQLV